MRKMILSLFAVVGIITNSNAQQKQFDKTVQLRTCHISIDANPFIATTVVEMEFYNDRDVEVEGYQDFELKRGQVITGFELELNGKYREGSIEERWKAMRAYSAIVGKRIDPAILQMDWQNHYSLRIYPIAAKSSRRIKFTITQMMEQEKLKLIYELPLKFKSKTEEFTVNITVRKPASIPTGRRGFLEGKLFDMNEGGASLSMSTTDVMLDKPISFSISQFVNQPQICISKTGGQAHFMMRLYPEVPEFYAAKPKSMIVYWDVSLSARQRNLVKELDFLERYILENEIAKTTIILFNHQLQGTLLFRAGKDKFNPIRNFLLNYPYSGGTELGNLNFNNTEADVVLLFSDGINTLGNSKPRPGMVKTICVVSGTSYDYNGMSNLIGLSGGTIISLYHSTITDAMKKTDSARNYLFRYNANHIRFNESFPLQLGNGIFLSGSIDKPDYLELVYGNNNTVYRTESHFISPAGLCDEQSYLKMCMLKTYDSLVYRNSSYYNWQNLIVFGLTEKVVTPQTSYLVLERIEDYIRYKIAPPKELEEKCAEMNYVYKPEYKIRDLKEFTEQDMLGPVVTAYNNRVRWWDKNEPTIDLSRPVPEKQSIEVQATAATTADKTTLQSLAPFDFKASGSASELKEVVVTSAFGIRRTARMTTSNAQLLTGDQVNTIRQSNVNDALAGKVAGAQVRSQSVAKLGAESNIRLRGENGMTVGSGAIYVVDGTIMTSSNDINPDDVEDITILQGPAAAALFGPDGANGAIVVNRKKARKNYPYESYVWTEYKLSDMKDVDYVQEMKNTGYDDLWDRFLELEKDNDNSNDPGFYFEMANTFFERGSKAVAHQLMYTAIELCKGGVDGQRLAGYLYEKWKYFDKAIAVYKGILMMNGNNMPVKRDLALAYFQNRNYAEAVRTYYSIITSPQPDSYNSNIREIAMAEMNALLVMHKNEFDISYINPHLLKALPVDLRITMESNYAYINNPVVIEPGNVKCSYENMNTRNGGRLTGYNYWYSGDVSEYAIKNAAAGKYRIKVNIYNYSNYYKRSPEFIRMIVFKNFQKENMKMEVKLFDLDNQYGVVELDEVSW